MSISLLRNYRVEYVDPNWVFIVDTSEQNKTVTITNSAESVVRELLSAFPGRRIVYTDTDDEVWELEHNGIQFTGFRQSSRPIKYNGHRS